MLQKATEDTEKKGRGAKHNKDINRFTYLMDAV